VERRGITLKYNRTRSSAIELRVDYLTSVLV